MEEIKKLIGHIGVDSGLVWIGDPCYILHREDDLPSTLGENWEELCEIIGNSYYKSFCYAKDREGLGVVSSTLYGDGYYPVFGIFKRGEDRPKRIIIEFENCNEDCKM